MKAELTVGIPASGKSTWAKEQLKARNVFEINRDDIRKSLFGFENYADYKFSRKNEQKVTEKAEEMIRDAATIGADIIVSDTNLNPVFRNKLISFCESCGFEVELVDFDIDFFEAVKRDETRGDKTVGRQVIYRMYKSWLEYKGVDKYVPDTTKPEGYLFDIDGTLADHSKNGRSPFEWKRVGEDEVIQHTKEMLIMAHNAGNKIVLLSGRDEVCRHETELWLKENNVPYDALYMRGHKVTRKDSIVKSELFFGKIAPNYNIKAVFDDRMSVALLWSDIGVPLFKVGDPMLEF